MNKGFLTTFLKILVLGVFLFLLVPACKTHKKATAKSTTKTPVQKKTTPKPKPNPKPNTNNPANATNKSKADSIVNFAKKFIGVKYKYGGQDPKGFDCSGFVCYVFAHNGIKLPRTADAQAMLGKEITRKNILPGDLVYFLGRDLSNKSIAHVGIVVENNNGQIKFISATSSSGIRIDDLDGAYWKERFVNAKRILVKK